MYIYPNMNMRIGCFVRSSLIHSRISRDTAAKIVIIRHIVSVIYQACTRGVVTAKEGVCLRYSGLFFSQDFTVAEFGCFRLLAVLNCRIQTYGCAELLFRILYFPVSFSCLSPLTPRAFPKILLFFSQVIFKKHSRTGLIRIRGISCD